ncbi:MAG TPA: HAMP domain-containing sensor histidine kinase [Solirubrobacteraceae bacterium]|nr:HAMP domain-containing sensor histidine kinase [Solirubrobacteraceae bacterium]
MILCVFALAIGSLTVHRIRSDFNREVLETAEQLPGQMVITFPPLQIKTPLKEFTDDNAVLKIFTQDGDLIAQAPRGAPSFGPAPSLLTPRPEPVTIDGYRVATRRVAVVNAAEEPEGYLTVQYARPIAATEATCKRVELLLVLGVLAGSVFALFAGMAVARRAMAPIAALTSAAAEIARTRDPSGHVPQTQAEDEVAELARTLESMLRQLDAARSETEATLARQRQFVADASHELRTPLTSVLANLELLAESLHGDEAEAARSALRSSHRMRRLVADLLLLARSDAGRVAAHEPCELANVVVDAAGELGPVSAEHEISLDIHPAKVLGSRDELHRVAVNLIENALRHTPAGCAIHISTSTRSDGSVELAVEDDGPGVPAELAPTLFERFVRGAGDRGGSFGLGLAIVKAVAISHGGAVTLEPSRIGHPPGSPGARFVVRLPGLRVDADSPGASAPVVELAQRGA